MSDMTVWDSNEVSVIIAGIPVESGRGEADGVFLSIERDADVFGDTTSTDGDVVRFKTNDHRATATLSLMNTSATNAVLSALYQLDRNTSNGAGVGPFLVEDRNGTTLHTGAKCWIAKTPKVDLGGKPYLCEWKIRIANLIDFHGGT